MNTTCILKIKLVRELYYAKDEWILEYAIDTHYLLDFSIAKSNIAMFFIYIISGE